MTDAPRIKPCLWCGSPFPAMRRGAHEKLCCSPACKDRFNAALRRYGRAMFEDRLVSVETLRDVYSSCTIRRSAA